MAITSAAAAVTVTTPAKDSVNDSTNLAGQTGAADEIVFPSAISTNNGNLVGSPTFAGRTVILRRGGATEETKFIAEEFGDGLTCRVNEDWTLAPSSGDSYDISYIAVDANTIGARFVVLQKRISDWTVSVPFIVGSGGGTFAYFSLLEGHSIESDNSVGDVQRAFLIENGARWDIGYISFNTPVSSGFLISTADVEGDTSLEVLDNGEIRFLDTLMSCVNNTRTVLNGVVVWNKGKVFSGSTGMDFVSGATGGVTVTDFTVEGRGTIGETIAIDENFVSNSMNIISTRGFISGTTALDGELEVRNAIFVGNLRDIFIEQDQTWNMVNPVWSIDEGSTGNFDYTTGSATGVVNEKFSLDLTVTSPTGGAFDGSSTYVYESTPGPTLPGDNRQVTGAGGTAASDILKRTYTRLGGGAGLTGVIHDDFALKIYKYGRLPVVSTIVPDEGLEFQITLLSDDFQVESSEATAVADGTSGADIIEAGANEHSIFKWENGSGTLGFGSSLVGNSSGATGQVLDIIEGDSTAGTAILITRSSSSFNAGAEILSEEDGGEGDWTATGVTASEQRYHWCIHAGNQGATPRSAQELYDHMQAKLAENPIDTADFFDDVVTAGRAEFANPYQGVGQSPNTFKTVRNVALSQGWCVAGLNNLSSISGFTDNAGVLFAAAATVNLNVQVDDENADGVEGVRVLIFITSSEVAITSGETNTAGLFTDVFSYISDVDVTIRARLKGFIPFEANGTIISTGLSVGVRFIKDTIIN